MLSLARNLTGTLIAGIVFSTVLFGHAMAADTKCGPYKEGIAGVAALAQQSGSKLAVITPENMPKFVSIMKGEGQQVKGDAAILMATPAGKIAIFVKRGDKLCLATIWTPPTPKADAVPAKPAPKQKVPGQEWI